MKFYRDVKQMEIHTVIQQRRKALGLTQEQVAEYLGVTAPAVNKWEKGSTCPDIGMLPPLARLLKTDLNTLLGFHESITRQEISLFCKEIAKTVQTDGFEAGFSAALEKIHAYPNSDTLLHTLALQLQGLLATAELGEVQANAYLEEIHTWYEKLTHSEDSTIRNGACFMLASRAVCTQQYGKAQEYLDQMPNRNDMPDKRPLQASVYLGSNQPEEAAALIERTLLSAISDLQMAIYKLIEVNVALGDMDTASYAAEKSAQLAQVFALSPYAAIAGPLMISAAKKDVPQSLILLRKLFESLSCEWNVQSSPLFRRTGASNSGSSMKGMTGVLIQGLQAPEYAYLWDNAEFQELLNEFGDQK